MNIHTLLSFHSEVVNTSLFYSTVDGIVFFIAGRDYINEPDKLNKILENGVTSFSLLAQVKKSSVKTLVVSESLSHNDLRVFYAKTQFIPEEAYKLDCKIWTMSNFLKC